MRVTLQANEVREEEERETLTEGRSGLRWMAGRRETGVSHFNLRLLSLELTGREFSSLSYSSSCFPECSLWLSIKARDMECSFGFHTAAATIINGDECKSAGRSGISCNTRREAGPKVKGSERWIHIHSQLKVIRLTSTHSLPLLLVCLQLRFSLLIERHQEKRMFNE